MKQHIKTLPHHPKRVIVISTFLALIIGIFGYIEIHKQINTPANNIIEGTQINANSQKDILLGFLTNGRIKNVMVKPGDKVTKGQILATLDAGNAQGALSQAEAAYEVSKANYQKIINGATSTSIDVAKAAVNTAQVNLDGVTKQQNIAVNNAHANLLNSSVVAKATVDNSLPAPIISGTYTKEKEGVIQISINQGGNTSGFFTVTGIYNGTGTVSTTTPEPILDTGLQIEFPNGISYLGTTWTITLPNTNASNYLANYNAYQTAINAKNQAIANAEATLDQANASLAALVATARPEDVATAQAQMNNAAGAVEIARAAYNNTIITAPDDGTIVAVSISPGQMATANTTAIDFISENLNQ